VCESHVAKSAFKYVEDAEARAMTTEASVGGTMTFGILEVNEFGGRCLFNKKHTGFKPKEYELLHYLAMHRGQVLPAR
jgi:DNA-binding response OmpR family regulator